jgi:hypothetical protein
MLPAAVAAAVGLAAAAAVGSARCVLAGEVWVLPLLPLPQLWLAVQQQLWAPPLLQALRLLALRQQQLFLLQPLLLLL